MSTPYNLSIIAGRPNILNTATPSQVETIISSYS